MIFTKTSTWFEERNIGHLNGFAWPDEGYAVVKEELSESVHKFVASHEDYHLDDDTSNAVLRELKASVHAGIRHPKGALKVIVQTLFDRARMKHYHRLIKMTFPNIDIDIRIPLIRVEF